MLSYGYLFWEDEYKNYDAMCDTDLHFLSSPSLVKKVRVIAVCSRCLATAPSSFPVSLNSMNLKTLWYSVHFARAEYTKHVIKNFKLGTVGHAYTGT